MIKRNKALDIARGICIFLIVLSHSYCSWESWFTFYYVQVFFFLSGIFLTKSHTLEKSLYKKIKSLIFPYLFFWNNLFYFSFGNQTNKYRKSTYL